jgi:hypothetical protein
MEWLNDLFSFLIAFPFLITFLLGWIAFWRSVKPKTSVILIVDGSGMFFWLSIVALLKVRDPESDPFLLILAIFILLAGLLFALQYRIRGKIDVVKVVRSIWRLGFIVSLFIYVWLITSTIGMYMDMV